MAINPPVDATKTPEWAALQKHYDELQSEGISLKQWFADDAERVEKLSFDAGDLHFDLSKNLIKPETLQLFADLAKAVKLDERTKAMYTGVHINNTEDRAVLHTALRAPRGQGPFSDEVHAVLDAMLTFVDGVWATAGGPNPGDIHDVVNIGIGGSDLGPQMVVMALEAFAHPRLRCHFVSNIDGQDLAGVLRQVDPKHTLFIVASKTFTTQETMVNARTARQWFLDQGGTDIARHFVATTSNVEAAAAFGITTTFGFWDWVGGRFSLWSAIGLPIALALGRTHFRALLAGAHAMDQHFASAPSEANLPLWLGLMDVWYRNFKGYTSRCVAPYHHGLRRLPAYLQQLVMESNGKSVDRHGQPLTYATSEVVWGEPGVNGQHAFFQMLHQGTDVIPVEFILFKGLPVRDAGQLSPAVQDLLHRQHQMLLANGLAQAQALMWGKTTEQAAQEVAPTASKQLAPQVIARHRTFPGNRPSLTMVIDALTPRSLGALIALYEHRVLVSGALWGINSFDQWGVELGKAMSNDLLPRLDSGDVSGLDPATAAMIARLRGA